MEHTKGRSSNSGRKRHQQFLKAWIRAGAPRHFRTDGNFQQIMDAPAMREKLKIRNEDPIDLETRLLEAEIAMKLKRINSR